MHEGEGHNKSTRTADYIITRKPTRVVLSTLSQDTLGCLLLLWLLVSAAFLVGFLRFFAFLADFLIFFCLSSLSFASSVSFPVLPLLA
jgi:hypothetical protein